MELKKVSSRLETFSWRLDLIVRWQTEDIQVNLNTSTKSSTEEKTSKAKRKVPSKVPVRFNSSSMQYTSIPSPSISLSLCHTIRYTAGYVTRALTRFDNLHIPSNNNWFCAWMNLPRTRWTRTQTIHQGSGLINAVDRSGLKHVSDITYMFFSAMEVTT